MMISGTILPFIVRISIICGGNPYELTAMEAMIHFQIMSEPTGFTNFNMMIFFSHAKRAEDTIDDNMRFKKYP